MLVYLTGRRSGRHYRQPVSYVHYGDALLTPGGGNWKLNLLDGQPVHVRLRGHDITARPDLVSDVDQIESLLGVLVAKNRGLRASSAYHTTLPATSITTCWRTLPRHGFRIVRWHPADTKYAQIMRPTHQRRRACQNLRCQPSPSSVSRR